MDTNYINIIKGAFIKNIVKIIVVGIVCSIALVCEKSFTTDFVVESGDLIQTKIIKVNDPNDSPCQINLLIIGGLCIQIIILIV